MHDPLHMVRVDEAQVALVQHAIALDEHPVRAVDQDLGHRRIAQQHFQRAETGEFVHQLFGQALHFIAGNRQVQAGDVLGHLVGNEARQCLARTFQQVFSRLLDGVDDVAMQHQLQALVIGVADGAVGLGAKSFSVLIDFP